MPEAYYTYAEEADDAANKVSQRKRIGMFEYMEQSPNPSRTKM